MVRPSRVRVAAWMTRNSSRAASASAWSFSNRVAPSHAAADSATSVKMNAGVGGTIMAVPLRSTVLRLHRLHRRARLLPSAETALDVAHRREPHVLRDLRGQRRTPATAAEEHELVARREERLVVRARGVDPELEHAASDVDGPWDATLAPQLARIAQVDERHAGLAEQGAGLLDGQRLDLGRRLGHHVLHALADLQWHLYRPFAAGAQLR